MAITIHHITRNPIVLSTVVMSAIGWLIAFIGACIIGKAGLTWWVIIYELLLLGSIFFSVYRNSFYAYRTSFLVFMGVSISMLTSSINGLIQSSSTGSQTSAAGSIILIIMQYFWVILFGSTEDSSVYRFVYSERSSSSKVENGVQLNTKESKVALSSPESSSQYNHQSVTSVHQNHQIITPIQSNTNQSSIIETTCIPQKLTAVALHQYNANPEDPNELSFVKDEVVEVLNKSGNWWQAKKQDGSIGIVPSNYFAQPTF